jgi:hypothetical protein
MRANMLILKKSKIKQTRRFLFVFPPHFLIKEMNSSRVFA